MSDRLTDYAIDIPEELIAQTPQSRRDASRLMVLHRTRGTVRHAQFSQLPQLLRHGDLLVRNATRVIPARLLGQKEGTGGAVEMLLLHRVSKAPAGAVARYQVMAQPLRRLGVGTRVVFGDGVLRAQVVSRTQEVLTVDFFSTVTMEEALAQCGEMPLPPYITRRLHDPQRYQTVYATEGASAAAPTAGLHFTSDICSQLRHRGVEIVDITLTVGLGTFAAIRSEDISQHEMHTEHYNISTAAAEAITTARQHGRRIIAVGTTVVRALESAVDDHGVIRSGTRSTNIFIRPPHTFRVVDAMITNFHVPQSSLIIMVSAFASREHILHAYACAVRERYRFFSFGDAMMIIDDDSLFSNT